VTQADFLDGIPHRPPETFLGEVVLHQVVLRAPLHGFDRDAFTIRASEHDHCRHVLPEQYL
jgi:hypothetical protein